MKTIIFNTTLHICFNCTELETRAHKGEQPSFVSSSTPQYHLRTKNTSNNKKKEIVLRDSKVSSSTSDIENYESSSED